MFTVTFVLTNRPTAQEKTWAENLARVYRERGLTVRVLTGPLWSLGPRLLTSRSDVMDFHGARAAWGAWLTRAFKRSARTIVTLHEREEFRPGLRFWSRLRVRLGTAIALRCAHEVVATQKLLQVVLLRQHGRLPTYVPQGASVPPATARVPLPRGLRPRTYLVAVTGRRTPQTVAWLRRAAKAAHLPTRIVTASLPPGDANQALLRGARAIVILDTLPAPGPCRELALTGRPIIARDTPEHGEALAPYALLLRSLSRDHLREGLRALATHEKAATVRATRAARRITRLFAWEEVATELLAVYRAHERTPVFVDSLSPRVSLNTIEAKPL